MQGAVAWTVCRWCAMRPILHRSSELSEAAYHKAADHVLDVLTEQLEVC